MYFMNWIIERCIDIFDFFYDIYFEVVDWPWPFYLVAEFFEEIAVLFLGLAGNFYDFNEWLEWAEDMIADILSWSNIRSLIRSWLYRIEDVVDWWYSWTTWVGQEIGNWWLSVKVTVQGWIDAAVEGLAPLLVAWDTFWNIHWPDILHNVSELRSLWDNFWTTIFPNLVDFTALTTWWNTKLLDIQGLIDTALSSWTPLLESWQDWRDSVAEFFTDPEDWLYKSVDRIIERFW